MRVVSAVMSILLSCVPLLAQSTLHQKRPAEYSLEERLSERFSDTARIARIRAAGQTASVTSEAADVIRGSVDPHLFLPFELFETFVRGAFSDDPNAEATFRRILAHRSSELIRDEGFWIALDELTARYRAARENLRVARFADDGGIDAARNEVCRARHDALRAAEAAFGSAIFREFLYSQIAPMQTTVIERHDPGREKLTAMAGGCR